MERIDWMEGFSETMRHLSRNGVFLTTGGETPNVMTIGWAWMGYCWRKPVFAVVVRPQRHTYGLIRAAGEFAVSVPTGNDLADALRFAGTKSGRDVNKFIDHGISAAPAQKVGAPIVAECGLHYECRTLLTQDMTADEMNPQILSGCYPQHDFHTIFFGEIVDCYRT